MLFVNMNTLNMLSSVVFLLSLAFIFKFIISS